MVVHPSSDVIHPCTYMPGNKLIIAILHCKVEISLTLALVENLHPSRFQAFHFINKHITKESDLILPPIGVPSRDRRVLRSLRVYIVLDQAQGVAVALPRMQGNSRHSIKGVLKHIPSLK
jgi:hypothetical protein